MTIAIALPGSFRVFCVRRGWRSLTSNTSRAAAEAEDAHGCWPRIEQGGVYGVQAHFSVNPLHDGVYGYTEKYWEVAAGPLKVGLCAGAESGGGFPDAYSGVYIELGPASDGPRVGLELGLSTDGPFCGGFVAGEREDSVPSQQHYGDKSFSFCRSSGWAFDACFLLNKQRQQQRRQRQQWQPVEATDAEGSPNLLGARAPMRASVRALWHRRLPAKKKP